MNHVIRFQPWTIALMLLAAFGGWPAVAAADSQAAGLPAGANPAPARIGPEDRVATLLGTVSSAQTNNYLEGARVELPALNRQTFTDQNGRFLFSGLPAGELEVRVTYADFAVQNRIVTAQRGARVTADFLLGGEVVQMAQFVVNTEREGQALAITSQRNADNVKNVVALDALGNMPNTNPGELAVRLPGVAARLDEEGNVTGVVVRGSSANLNRVTVDGNLISNVGGFGRDFQTHSLSGAMFEQLEVIKGQMPDQSADSIGGNVNLKTRSSLSLKEKRRFNYSVGARWAPSFFEQTRARLDHPSHPQINLGYQEVFSAFGGHQNLGVALTAFYSENVNVPDTIEYDYQNTTALPAYTWDYERATTYRNRRQNSFNLKTEYRWSESTKIIANVIYNDANEAFNRAKRTTASSNQTIAALNAAGQPTGTGAIVPGYSATFTEVRAVSGSNLLLTSSHTSFLNRTRYFNLGAEHKFSEWEFNYEGSYSRTHINQAIGRGNNGGSIAMTAPAVGWKLDTRDPAQPLFTQTAGPDIYAIGSYTSIVDTVQNGARDVDVYNYRADARYRVPTALPLFLKTGVFYRHHFVAEVNGSRRWTYVGARSRLPVGHPFRSQGEVDAGRDLPFLDAASVYGELGDRTLWTEDLYYGRTQPYSASRNATEEIMAGYVMGQGKWQNLGFLAGVRTERTEVKGFGYFRGVLATAAQIPDPVARAEADWNNPVHSRGNYTRSFPSIHLTYDLTKNMRARASGSTSFGRPAFTSLVPAATISDTARTVTINNPGLGPQYARNLDLALDYAFKPAGLISIGYFRKAIQDYILTTDIDVVAAGNANGFDGDYVGYVLRSQRNAGTANISGWEFDYRQQFTFLPGLLKGLGASANLTVLETEGNFGGTAIVSTKRVAGFVPRTGNASVSYNYRGIGVRVLLSYMGEYLNTSATSEARLLYRNARTIVNAGVSYQLRPELALFCDVSNVFNEPQRQYRYVDPNVALLTRNGPAVTFGVSGRY